MLTDEELAMLVQRFGMGIELARRRCRDNGNPEPHFEFSSSSVLVTLRRRP
jgi:predicted HTH transcriptional regulator